MKLNTEKYEFEALGGKCLDLLVDERGVEANLDKVRAIIKMNIPITVKEVQRITGCVAALGRFLSRHFDKSLHIFKTLKQSTFNWDDTEEEAFHQLKEHLANLSKLVPPCQGRCCLSI